MHDVSKSPGEGAQKRVLTRRLLGRRRELTGPLAAVVAAMSAVAYVGSVDPNTPGHYPTCPFLFLTGWYCPGCGALRCLHALAHGSLTEALDRNILAVAAVGILSVWWLAWVARRVRGRPRTFLVPGWAIWSLAAIVVMFGVVRNTPWGAALAP
jgi:hypothetical protein